MKIYYKMETGEKELHAVQVVLGKGEPCTPLSGLSPVTRGGVQSNLRYVCPVLLSQYSKSAGPRIKDVCIKGKGKILKKKNPYQKRKVPTVKNYWSQRGLRKENKYHHLKGHLYSHMTGFLEVTNHLVGDTKDQMWLPWQLSG